jgi:hypothetical protein
MLTILSIRRPRSIATCPRVPCTGQPGHQRRVGSPEIREAARPPGCYFPHGAYTGPGTWGQAWGPLSEMAVSQHLWENASHTSSTTSHFIRGCGGTPHGRHQLMKPTEWASYAGAGLIDFRRSRHPAKPRGSVAAEMRRTPKRAANRRRMILGMQRHLAAEVGGSATRPARSPATQP